MNTENIKNWASLLANVGVLTGLVFLIIEINQTNSLMRSEERYNRLEIALSGPDLIVQNPHLITALRKRDNEEELTEDERYLLNSFYVGNFIAWQWSWEELDSADLPIESFLNQLSIDDVRAQWEKRKALLKPSFTNFMEERLAGQ